MASNSNALKLSVMLGVASGIGSFGLYYMLAKKKDQKENGLSAQEQMKFTNEVEEMQDEADI
jgi:hypothetical protein